MQINGVTILHDYRQCLPCLKRCVNFQINVEINKELCKRYKIRHNGLLLNRFIYKNFNNKFLLHGNKYGLIKAQYSKFCKYYCEMLS